jgi:hypothetical protein
LGSKNNSLNKLQKKDLYMACNSNSSKNVAPTIQKNDVKVKDEKKAESAAPSCSSCSGHKK